ncbi:MAG: hypothetical protein WAW02_10240 [Sideroxyarcus sp.]
MKTRKQYRALLDRAHGYAAQARRMQPARRTPRTTQRSWSLAQAIATRYAAIERRWPVMALVFEQPERTAASVSYNYHTTHPSIFMNPRVILRMLVSQREVLQHAVADRASAQPFSRESAPMTLATTARQKQATPEQDDVIARIVRRAVREENPVGTNGKTTERAAVPAAQISPGANTTSTNAPTLARVLRHVAKANNDESSVAATARTEKETPDKGSVREMKAAAVQSPVDITRITDQVMQALDRRIVAQRERLGRV